MVAMPVAYSDGFTQEDMQRLPQIEGASHELVDGLYVITGSRPFTAADLDALPEFLGGARELLDGVIVLAASPSSRHQGFLVRLILLLNGACGPDQRVRPAPLDVSLSAKTTIQPDVLVVRRSSLGDRRLIEGAPELAVEILSPSTKKRDRVVKRRLLEQAGCPSYWIVDPADPPTLTVLELEDERYVEVARVTGSESWTATTPFPVTVVPDDLVDD